MNEITIDRTEVVKYQGEGGAIEQAATALAVVDEPSRAQAMEMRERARQFKKAVEEKFAPARESALKAHREIVAIINEMIGPADRVVKLLDRKTSDYQLEQDRIRRAEQARIDAETRASEQAERDRLMKLAEKQMDKGNMAKAEETLARAEDVFIPAPVLPTLDRAVVTESGYKATSRKDFDVIILSPIEVVRAIASGNLPVGVARMVAGEIKITPAAIKDAVKMTMTGDNIPQVPGCRIAEKYVQIGRGRSTELRDAEARI